MSVERRDAIARAQAPFVTDLSPQKRARAATVVEAAVVEWERAHPPTFTNEQIEQVASERRDFIQQRLGEEGVPPHLRRVEADIAEAAVVEWERAHPPTFTDEQIDAFCHALQVEWDEFCADTGNHPDWIMRVGRQTRADFFDGSFHPFARAALAAVFSVSSEPA